MKRKKVGKVVAVSLIVVLVTAIFGILKISSIDKYAGLVKVKNASLASISTKLKANISDLSEDNNIEVKGYDEIDYNISYRLSDVPGERDVIINAKIDERDIYASFKEVTGTDITSILSSNRKEITITIKNLPANEQINSKVTLVIENAPKGYTVSPRVRIKESTSEEYTNINVKAVTVNTNSLQGQVIDEEGNKVTNILISLKKNNEIIKETYVNSEGIYTFSDITPDTYSVVVNEENYENLEINDLYIEEGNVLNLIVKKVYPYSIETNKYITKVELNNIGTKKDYLYNDVTLAQIPVKKVDDLHGKIYYKITVQNTGEKSGIISSVRDELPEGLSFDEKLNSGYELKNGIIYNRNLEGVELSAGEQITDTLILTIDNTDIAKTYINKVNARGELYEHVVYLLNGKLYKTLDVLEGETLDEVIINNPNFSGWYTDEKLTNKYKFELPVEKDLILYGVTAKKHTVVFNDKHPETLVETKYDEQEVNNGEKVTKPNPDPEKDGYDFCGWTKDDVNWDFNTPVTEDMTLVSKYCIKSYPVEFYDNSASNGAEYEKILTLSKEYKSTLTSIEAPNLDNVWEGHTFLKWTTDQEGQHEYDFTSLITAPVKLYAQYTLQERDFIFDDENRITEKIVNYGETVQAIADQGKEGHTFKHWSLERNGDTPFDFNTRIYQTTRVYAVYQINTYNVIFNDTDPWTNVTQEHTRQTVEWGKTATEPVEPNPKEGHTFCGWLLNGVPYDFETKVKSDITLDSCYTKNNVHVYFMDGTDIWETKTIPYASLVTAPETSPTKEHKIFAFWSEDNTNAFNFAETQIKEDKYLYAQFDDITPPTITHLPLYWTNDKVVVTVSHQNPALTFKYKVDDNTYSDYTTPFDLETNSTIVAKSVYGEVESEITSHEVTNIDKLNPVIGTLTTEVTKNSITISGTVTDEQSGVRIINIINGNSLVGSVNGVVNNLDLRDYTKEKGLNYTISGLSPSTEYTYTIQVIDGAGNTSETTVTATTEREEPVCRIISIDGVDLPEEDWIEFTLLRLAIEDSRCDSKCTIQMIKGTNESVEILNTQDITLDLNGKTVSGVKPGYTVDNQGEFTLVDHAGTPGGIINGQGIAVKNNAGSKFTMGEGSSEAPVGTETRSVSITAPYIFGESYGLYSESGAEFSFFDGKIKGTNAVQGEVTETEYTYNAVSNDVSGYEEVTLAILDNPEARLNKSRYFSNLPDAVTVATGGTVEVEKETKTLLSGFRHTTEKTASYDTQSGYTFIYDAENDTLTSSNDIYGSEAFTDTIIDLTDYEEDQIFVIQYRVDNNTESIDENQDRLRVDISIDILTNPTGYNYGSKRSEISDKDGTKSYLLQKGGKYRVNIRFSQAVKKVSGTYTQNSDGSYSITAPLETSPAKLVVTSATLTPDIKIDNGGEVQDDLINLFSFYYDEATDTFRSNNSYWDAEGEYNKQIAYARFHLDLSNKPSGTYNAYFDASIEGAQYSRGFIYINGPYNPAPIYNTGNTYPFNIRINTNKNRGWEDCEEFYGYPYIYQKIGPVNSSITSLSNSIYDIWFIYYKDRNTGDNYTKETMEQYGISDQFIINSIKVVRVGDSEVLDIPTSMVGNAFETEPLSNGSEIADYGLRHNSVGEYHDSYVKIDLTNSDKDKIFEIESRYNYYNYLAIYLTNNNKGLTLNEINSNRYNMLMYKDDFNNTSTPYLGSNAYMGAYSSTADSTRSGYLLEKGNVYYVHFNSQLSFSHPRYDYRNSEYPEFECYNIGGNCGAILRGLKLIDVEETVLNFGKYKINTGTVDIDGLPEESSTINLRNTDTVTLNEYTPVPYVYNSEEDRYELSRYIQSYEVGDFSLKIDLTNETRPQKFYYDWPYPSGANSTYSYYSVDTECNLQRYPDGGLTVYPSCTYTSLSSSTYFILNPGHVYYFRHAVATGSNWVTSDYFSLKKVEDNPTTEYTYSEPMITFNEKVDEIQLLKNIGKSVTIDPGKEVILDLNGYKLYSSWNSIKNYGKLTIKDSDYEQQTGDTKTHNGIIEGSQGSLITNYDNATLTIKNVLIDYNTSNSSQNNAGIDNKGDLIFVEGYDSVINVNKRYGIGIHNFETGRILEAKSSLNIVLNYSGSVKYGSYYAYLDTGSINKGLYNDGYLNLSGLKISGACGTGLYNNSKGVAILKDSDITVTYRPNDISYGYKYRYNSNTYYDITDYSVSNSGLLTIKDTNIGMRYYNGSYGNLYVMPGSTMNIVINAGQMFAKLNGTFANSLANSGNATIESADEDGEVSIRDYITNTGYNWSYYGHLKLFNFNNTNNSFYITNNNYGNIEGYDGNYSVFNNNNNGEIRLVNGTAKYIKNEGKSVTLNNITVDNDGTSYEAAIQNSGILNLEYGVNIIDHNKYAILMKPISTTSSSVTTYSQVLLNIGTDLEHQDSVVIQGLQYGVTGPCYYNEKTTRTNSNTVKKTVKLSPFGATTAEEVLQEKYDQTFCMVNFYSGEIKGQSEKEKLLDIPIFETQEGNNVQMGYDGLKVTSNENIVAYENDLTDKHYAAQIGNTKYYTIEDAINSVTSNDPVTIDVIGDNAIIRSINIPEGKNITINYGNGTNTYSYANKSYINSGSLTTTGSGNINVASKYVYDNSGIMSVSNSNYDNMSKLYPRESALVNNSGDITVTNGLYNNIDIFNTKNASITGGTYNGSMFYGVGDTSNTLVKEVKINDGNVPTHLELTTAYNTIKKYDLRHIFDLHGGAIATLEDYNTNDNTEYAHSRPIAHVVDSTFIMKNSEIGLPTDEYNNPVYIAEEGNSTVTINGGNYNNIYLDNNGATTEIVDGTFKGYSTFNLLYMHGKTPIAHVINGSLESNGNVIGLSDYSRKNGESNSYYLTLGTKGDKDENNEIICSKTSPSIKGEAYGIVSYGTVSGNGYLGFFDGIVKGLTNSIDTEVNEIEDDFEIITEQDSYHTKYLDQQDLVLNKTTGVRYKTFQKAFNEAGNGDILETLRNYTNTVTTDTIEIPSTANFTLRVKYDITVNNEYFIVNHGNVTFEGIHYFISQMNNADTGLINSNTDGVMFTNDGTLTLKGLDITNVKGGRGTYIVNNSGTVNILGSVFNTLQTGVVLNDGILNIDKMGTDECYYTTIFNVGYQKDSACSGYTAPITTTEYSTSSIDYLTIDADGYCQLISNQGNMTINHSTFDQTNYYNSDKTLIKSSGSELSTVIISNRNNLSINNSKLIIVPTWLENSLKYVELDYIGNPFSTPSNVTINNTFAETSKYGLVHTRIDNSSIDIKNTTLHNHSYGVMYDGKTNINLENNTFNIHDAAVEFNRENETYYSLSSLFFFYPEGASKESVINIDGGYYKSDLQTEFYANRNTYIPTSDVHYSTKCVNGSMNDITVAMPTTIAYDMEWSAGPGYKDYYESYTNLITSAGTLNINNATLVGDNRIRNNYDSNYYSVYDYSTGEYPGTNHKKVTSGIFGIITAFGETNIKNSTVDGTYAANTLGINFPTGKTLSTNDGVLTLGTKDGTYDIDDLQVISSTSTPISGGQVKFYDGVIKPSATLTNIVEVEENYVLAKDNEKIYLITDPVVHNVEKDIDYTNVQTAINEAENGDTLKFLRLTIGLANQTLTIDGKTLTLDLNGKEVACDLNLVNSANLTVTDSDDGGNIRLITQDSTSTITLLKGTGLIYAHNTVYISGSDTFVIWAYDNANIIANSATNNGYVWLRDSSSISVNNSTFGSIQLDNDSTFDVSCTTDDDTVINGLSSGSSVPLNISKCTFNSIANAGTTMNITGGKIKNVSNRGTTNINGITIQGSVTNESGTLSLTNCTVVASNIKNTNNYLNNPATINIYGGTYKTIYNYGNTLLNIYDGEFRYIMNKEYSEYFTMYPTVNIYGGYFHPMDGAATKVYNESGYVNIGTPDGVVSTTSPKFEGDAGGILYNKGIMYSSDFVMRFYDGIVIGPNDKSLITNVTASESGYHFVENPYGDGLTAIILAEASHYDSGVAMVNGIYYSSLQQAINKAVVNCDEGSTCPNVTLTHNAELDADLTIQEGYTVNIVTSGYTISTNGYAIPAGITVNGQPYVEPDDVGGNIVNGIKDMLGLTSNTKDVLIYEMSDGSTLSTENHYRLYKYNGSVYDLVTMEKGSEVARYNPGKGLENMKPIKGRLYLTDLEPGNYKVSDDNGSEVTFTINDDLTLSGHVKEYIPSNSNIESTGEAKLLITIQTGIRKVNYMLIAISLILVLSVMFVIRKRRENS